MISTRVSLLKKKKVHKKPTSSQFEEKVHFGAFSSNFFADAHQQSKLAFLRLS